MRWLSWYQLVQIVYAMNGSVCLIFVPWNNWAIIGRIISYLLIISKAAHDSWVHDAVEEHREGVDGKAGVV